MDQKGILSLIRAVSGQSNVLTIPRLFIDITGDIKSALFLSQCCYWDSKMGGRFYKTTSDWSSEICLSRHELDTVRRSVERYVKSELKKANGAPTIHYTVEWDVLQAKILDVLGQDTANGYVEKRQMDMSANGKTLTVDYNNKDINQISDSISIAVDPVYEPCNEEGEPLVAPKPVQAFYPIAQALADVCGMSITINAGKIFKFAKTVAKDPRVSAEYIRSVYSSGGAWYTQDWRGKQGQRPKLNDVAETLFMYDNTGNAQDNTIKGDLYSR